MKRRQLLLEVTICGALLMLYIAIRPLLEKRADEKHKPVTIAGTIDCGPTALYIVCKKDKKQVEISHLRELCETNWMGTNMFKLKEAAEQLGYKTEPSIMSFSTLRRRLSQPDVSGILLIGNRGHYASVFNSPVAGSVQIIDYPAGARDVNKKELEGKMRWQGEVLILTNLESN